MNVSDFVLVALQLGTMLGIALLLGQLMRKWNQPVVLGEMIGGIIVGTTILGAVFPQVYEWLFASSADADLIRESVVKLGMLFFLYIAGSEVDLTDLRRTGGQALSIGLIGTLLPIGIGVGLVYAVPASFWGEAAGTHLLAFALFIGMNLANAANPVLARILMDLGLLRTPLGTLSMAATIVDDLINWALFAVVLGSLGAGSSGGGVGAGVVFDIVLVLALFVLTLGVLRWLAPRYLPRLRRRLPWPSGFIAFVALLILGMSALSEGLGVHAFLGAFLVGAALGGHDKEHEEANRIVTQFSLSFFAPVYFVSMGMTTDFITNFDFALVAVITVVAFLSKLGAVLLGARVAGMPFDRNTWAIAFGLNARGATGIILAGVGLQTGVIDERVFVAIVVMALVTSFIAGPAMNSLLRPLYGRLGGKVRSNDDVPAYQEEVGPTLPSIRRILIPVRPGRQVPDNLDAAVEPHLLEGMGRKLEVTLLAVGSEEDSEAMSSFVGAVRDRYPDRPIRGRVVADPDPARAILAEAAQHDLIIVGAPESETGGPIVESPEFGAPESLMLGPVIQDILIGAPCPTMVIWRHLMHRNLRHILVPGDNTIRTQVATDLAFALAEGTGATVALLQVVQTPGHEPALQTASAVADSALQLRRQGADFESQIISAVDPAAAIRDAAIDVEADLVILTTRTYRELNGHIVGPTAVDLLTNPPCPVALVHVPAG